MRDLLAPLVGQRRRFRATVERLGCDHKGGVTVLLEDVADAETGLMLADHVWARLPPPPVPPCFHSGARLIFTAKVERYRHARDRQGWDYGLAEIEVAKG